MPELRLSALVVARNEEQNLAGCLESVRFADERVVVVDSASRDRTLEIARRHADVVTIRSFDNFASQRNAALALASGDWVLSIDADERVTPGLALEIRESLREQNRKVLGYRVPIRSQILGRAFGHSGTQQDQPVRLFRRECGRWIGPVHETVTIEGPIGWMENFLEHRTLPNIEVFLGKIDQYTSLEASDLYRAGHRFRMAELTLRPFWVFLKLYLYKQGFRDGLEGLVFCALSGISVAVRTWKLRELGLARGTS
jgi:glycosyltransferase involved in cell wall biosynthesis